MKPFTASFLRYGTLFDLEGYKDTISNKYKKLLVSSYMGRPILYPPHMKPITAAFFGTLFDLEGYKDHNSNKYKKLLVSSYMGRPILYAHLNRNHFTAAFLRYGTIFV